MLPLRHSSKAPQMAGVAAKEATASYESTLVHKEVCMNPVAKGWLRASIDLWRRLWEVPADSLLGPASVILWHLMQAKG